MKNIAIYEKYTSPKLKHPFVYVAGSVAEMTFDPNNKYLAIAGERHVHVFYNIPGYKATISSLLQQKKKAINQAHLQRITQQIDDARYIKFTFVGYS